MSKTDCITNIIIETTLSESRYQRIRIRNYNNKSERQPQLLILKQGTSNKKTGVQTRFSIKRFLVFSYLLTQLQVQYGCVHCLNKLCGYFSILTTTNQLTVYSLNSETKFSDEREISSQLFPAITIALGVTTGK